MNCQAHSQKILAFCQRCQYPCCLICILEVHSNHLNKMVLMKNIYVLIAEPYNFLIATYLKIYPQNNKTYINDQMENLLQLKQLLENDYDSIQLQQFIQIYESQYILRQIYLQIKLSSQFLTILKGQQLDIIYDKLESNNQKHLLLNLFDIYYILKHYGTNQYAFEVQKQTLMKLMKVKCFLDIKDDQIQSDKQYNQIDLDEHFIIQQGRNYFFCQEMTNCQSFLMNFSKFEEAKIYMALSYLTSPKLTKAQLQLNEIKQKCKKRDLIDFIQCYILFFESQYHEALNHYERLYQKYQTKFLQNQICYILIILKDYEKLLKFCDQAIEIDPQCYSAWLYKGVTFYKLNIMYGTETICHTLIKVQSQNIFGYALYSAYLIKFERIQEAIEFFNILEFKFKDSIFSKYFNCAKLLLEGKFKQSLYFLDICNPFYDLQNFLKILILLRMKHLPNIFDFIFQISKQSKQFYIILDILCEIQTQYLGLELNKMAFHDEAINLLEGYIEDDLKKGKNFYHVLLGKLLIDQGIKFKDLNIVEQGFYQLTNYNYDDDALPFIFYYRGQALLTIKKFDEATQCFEFSFNHFQNNDYQKKVIQNILIAHKFIQGNFSEVSNYLDYHEQNEGQFTKMIEGLLLWIQGFNDQSLQLISQLSNEFHLILIIISQIYQEQHKQEEADKILLSLNSSIPNFKQFLVKYSFITSGPYSQYIRENKEKFDNLEEKKFQAIKMVAHYVESQSFVQQYYPVYNSILADWLLHQILDLFQYQSCTRILIIC